jgi:hypothetical protein
LLICGEERQFFEEIIEVAGTDSDLKDQHQSVKFVCDSKNSQNV